MAKKKHGEFDPLEGLGEVLPEEESVPLKELLDEVPKREEVQEARVLPPPPPMGAIVVPSQQMSATTEELFGRPVETENSVKSVAKELFSNDVIDLKTEISHNEINNLTRLRFMQEKFRLQSGGNLDHVIASFLRLRVSKDRKSRKEFIEALQTETRNSQGGSFMQKLFGGGGPS